MRARLVGLAVAGMLAGCGGGSTSPPPGPSSAAPTSSAPSPSPSPAAASDQACTHPTEGYGLTFPADWFVADGEGIEPCSFFSPEPLELEPATEADGVAIRLDVMAEAFPEARRKVASDGKQEGQDTAVDGRPAVRFVGETDASGLLPPGLATTTWLVDLGGRSLLLTTDEGGSDDYAASVEVLDAMARSVQVP